MPLGLKKLQISNNFSDVKERSHAGDQFGWFVKLQLDTNDWNENRQRVVEIPPSAKIKLYLLEAFYTD
jgi:hypothetical protein